MSALNKNKLSHYMNAAEVMDKVFDVYKRSFFYQIGLNFCVYTIGAVCLYVILLVIGISGLLAGVYFSSNPGDHTSTMSIYVLIIIAAFVVIWMLIIYFNLIVAATCFLSWQSFSNKPINFSVALTRVLKSFFRIASVSLAQMIAGIPVIILIIAACYAMFADQGVLTIEFWLSDGVFLFILKIIFLMIIILLIGIITMIVYNYFALAIPIGVFDKKHFFTALKSSYELMKGDFWRILGTRLVFSGAVMLINYSFSSLSGVFIGAAAAFSNSLAPNINIMMTIGILFQYLVSFISSVLLMPLTSIFTSIVFFNQKIKNEGLDLAMQLEVLERTNGF